MSTKKIDKAPSPEKRVVDPFLEEVEKLILAKYSDPFKILGPHWIDRDGKPFLAIRVFRPGATEASIVLTATKAVHPAQQIQADGFFETVLPAEIVRPGNPNGTDAISPGAYRVRFRFADKSEIETYDPYAFPPVLTEYDLYLSGRRYPLPQLRETWRALGDSCRSQRRSICRVGAERAARERRWKFQSLGRTHLPVPRSRIEWRLGAFCARTH